MQFFPKKKALMYWKNHYGKIVNISSMHTRELPAKYYVGSTDMRTEDIAYLLGYQDKKEIPPAPPGDHYYVPQPQKEKTQSIYVCFWKTSLAIRRSLW